MVTYIQKKERLISALNSAIRTAEAPIYAQELNELIGLLLEDKLLPDSFDTHEIFPDLYPRATPKKEKQGTGSGKGTSKDDEEEDTTS